MLHLIHQVLVNVSILSPLSMKFQIMLSKSVPHEGCLSIFVHQPEWLLALLEELSLKLLDKDCTEIPFIDIPSTGISFIGTACTEISVGFGDVFWSSPGSLSTVFGA